MANKKCLAKPSRSLLQLAILDVHMRWINYHSATVNISVSIEQRNIAFQSDISLKTMRFLGVLLSRESSDSRQNREPGRRATADLFVVFIAWTSQKASKVHKRLSKLAIALIWIFKVHMKTIVLWLLWNAQYQHIAERERSTTVVVLISGAFVWSRLIHERCLHVSETFAYRNAHNNLFLTRNPKVKNRLRISTLAQLVIDNTINILLFTNY